MVVNEDKTEIMWTGRKPDIDHLAVINQKFYFVTSIKALGIYISGDLIGTCMLRMLSEKE